jgi:hypothetical protein
VIFKTKHVFTRFSKAGTWLFLLKNKRVFQKPEPGFLGNNLFFTCFSTCSYTIISLFTNLVQEYSKEVGRVNKNGTRSLPNK